MSMIKVENLTFSYPSSFDNIFENCSFVLDSSWKLGFIGRNGRGKTTLLNLLMGKYEYSGSIRTIERFDYFPFPVPGQGRNTAEIVRELCPLAQEWELERELSLLDVEPGALYRPFGTLSSGEQTKVLLAALFLKEGNFLLIDEPTNHLDALGRAKVSKYLSHKRGFILVSHDRAFLDGCVDHILALNRAGIEVQSGNFSSWMQNFRQRQQSEQAQNDRLKRDILRLNESARRAADWASKVENTKYGSGSADRGFIGAQSARMMKRSKAIEARRQSAIEQKSALLKNVEAEDPLKLLPLRHHAQTLVSFEGVQVLYGGAAINTPATLHLQRGERVVLRGKNGSGKSSLIKLVVGNGLCHTGQVRLASGLQISYVPQDTAHLAGSLGEYAAGYGIDQARFKTILRKMGFERVQFEKDMRDYSAGQKKKVLLARSLCESAHIYVWDEPLNYVDVFSRMQIEELLLNSCPTMLLVEHDTAFAGAVATREFCL